MKIIFASSNVNKAQEYQELLTGVNVTIQSAEQYNPGAIEETGATFAENAILKATAIADLAKKPTFADDGGIVIPDFPEMAGLYSARFAEKHGGFPRVFDHMLAKFKEHGNLAAVPAFFECVIAFHDYKNDNIRTFSGRIDGQISFPSRGESGFGYDSIFVPVGYTETFAELGPSIKSQMSHRARATKGFVDYLKTLGL